jgi:methionyl aminopeptidase
MDMTEKDYSGATTSKIGKNAKAGNMPEKIKTDVLSKQKKQTIKESSEITDVDSYKKAGEIAKQIKEYAKSVIKKDEPLVQIAEKIEGKIVELGGELAFPVNLSIDDIAAHYTPTLRDETKASGLLKIDLGVHINGFICDLAFSIDLTPEKKYQKLIETSELALKQALEQVKKNKDKTTLSQIGKTIQEAIEKQGFSPIVNLSGHGLDEFDIHSGLTIPNYDNKSDKELGEGAFAIEPFATLKIGSGSIYEGAGSNIYHITGTSAQVRDNFAREVLSWILENKQTLPFSQREIEKKFGTKALMAIANLKRTGAINEFAQLIEKNHQPVSQCETSFIIHEEKVEILVE